MNDYGSDAGAADEDAPNGDRIIHTQVVDSYDEEGLGRVTVQIPWLDDPVVASVATGAAGKGRGMFFMPQSKDDVLVLVKQQPDLKAYVIGSLWTSQDVPPRREPNAGSQVQLIRTPGGHEIVLNDETGELVIKASGGQRVSLAKNRVEIRSGTEGDTATITLGSNGNIILSGSSIELSAKDKLILTARTVSISAQADCSVDGATVRLNEPGAMPAQPLSIPS